jgi:hypothetical protein
LIEIKKGQPLFRTLTLNGVLNIFVMLFPLACYPMNLTASVAGTFNFQYTNLYFCPKQQSVTRRHPAFYDDDIITAEVGQNSR